MSRPFGYKHTEETKHKMRLKALGENNVMWKGDRVGESIHWWIKQRLPKPKKCQKCDRETNLDLANISNQYKRDLSDWQYLCRRCHMLSDGRMGNLKQYAML